MIALSWLLVLDLRRLPISVVRGKYNKKATVVSATVAGLD
jgi:hypothetical protein